MVKLINVIYVEDSSEDVELFRGALERYKTAIIKLDIAKSVKDAKDSFNPDKHTAAILDWRLPDGDGLEVAEHIRSLRQDTAIIFLSGVFTEELVIKAKEFNPVACLQKDYTEEQIRKICSRIKQ